MSPAPPCPPAPQLLSRLQKTEEGRSLGEPLVSCPQLIKGLINVACPSVVVGGGGSAPSITSTQGQRRLASARALVAMVKRSNKETLVCQAQQQYSTFGGTVMEEIKNQLYPLGKGKS